jgi:hypothetical protein
MAAAIGLREDFSGHDLRRLARESGDAKQVRRLLALAVILDGGRRTEAARFGGVGLQIVRDFSPDNVLQHFPVEAELGDQLLQPPVLVLESFQPQHLRRQQSAYFFRQL